MTTQNALEIHLAPAASLICPSTSRRSSPHQAVARVMTTIIKDLRFGSSSLRDWQEFLFFVMRVLHFVRFLAVALADISTAYSSSMRFWNCFPLLRYLACSALLFAAAVTCLGQAANR